MKITNICWELCLLKPILRWFAYLICPQFYAASTIAVSVFQIKKLRHRTVPKNMKFVGMKLGLKLIADSSINSCWINTRTARKWPVKADQLDENNKTSMKPSAWFYFYIIHLIYFCFMTTVASLSLPVSPNKPMHEEAVSLLELTLYAGSEDGGW